jgi:group I intron endonuclease
MIGIYKITSPSNKVYIGQSWNIKRRWWEHRHPDSLKKKYKLYTSLNKYGVDNHKFEVLHELPKDIKQEVLDNYEVFYIQLYKDCGYNMLNCRDGGGGGKFDIETRKKMSEAQKGKKQSNETIYKRSVQLIGKKLRKKTNEEKIAMSKRMIGLFDGKKNTFYGKSHTDETKKIMSEKKNKPIIQLDNDGNIIKKWDSISEASKNLGILICDISMVALKQRGRKTAGGYKWEFS